jgi:phosphoribosylanthranilate isomerase
MARVKLKICGIMSWADARRACEAGADFLGFNFYLRSPRYITPGKARKIIRRLPQGVGVVGVFVDESEERMLEIAGVAGLGYLQLHGDETAAAVTRLARALPVIKAVRVQETFRPAQLARFARAGEILLDGFDRGARGGTGKTFDWDIAKRASKYGHIFLAGGLTPENIAEAIRVARPYAVDVCSGVESKPGKKDPQKLKQLARAIHSAQKRNR